MFELLWHCKNSFDLFCYGEAQYFSTTTGLSCYRRKKSDLREVTKLTAKYEKILFCKLTPRQRSTYINVIESKLVRNAIRRGSDCSFKAISLLRKICNHPDFALRNGRFEFDRIDECGNEDDLGVVENSLWKESGKLVVLAQLLPTWRADGDKVLIFSQTQSM